MEKEKEKIKTQNSKSGTLEILQKLNEEINKANYIIRKNTLEYLNRIERKN